MKRGFLIILMFATLSAAGQRTEVMKPTSSFTISGDVKSPATIQIADLKKWNAVNIGDVGIGRYFAVVLLSFAPAHG